MEYFYYTALVFLLAIIFPIYFPKFVGKSKLPPGPRPWPIIGNIHQLGDKPHRTLTELAKIYGSIMSLKIGTTRTIVVSSPEVAKEMFLKHDLALSSRNVPDIGRAMNHQNYSIVWLPVCPKWRNLRKIVTMQLFTSRKLDTSQGIRHKVVRDLVAYVRQCCEAGLAVDIGKAAFTTTLNLLSNTFFSIDFASYVSSDLEEFKSLALDLMEDVARPNVSDLFPLVKPFDLQGVLKKHTMNFGKMFGFFERIIDARLLEDPTNSKDDVLGTLLKLVQENELSLDELKHMLVDLFIAGTDTTSITLEWAMTELLRNPEKMAKAQIETDNVVGKHGTIQESNISKLLYIQAILKETIRLHPAAPFLLPHKAEKDVILHGYLIPKNSTIWVNVWSIGRDSNVWPNPECFQPERFLEREVDVKGRDFDLIPFGSGRRICPGMPLAHRILHLMLATLLHSFKWESGDIDVQEKFGISLHKAQSLQATPLSR